MLQNDINAKVMLAIFLYLNPNIRPSSLSTLIADSVSKETADNILKVTVEMAAE